MWASLFEKLGELLRLFLAFLSGQQVGKSDAETKILEETLKIKDRQERAANNASRNVRDLINKMFKHKF